MKGTRGEGRVANGREFKGKECKVKGRCMVGGRKIVIKECTVGRGK